MTRRKRRFVRFIFTLLILVFIGAVSAFIIIYMTPEPPTEQISRARQAVSAARAVNSPMYAPHLFKRAEQLYDSAILLWKFQNQEFFLKRNYDRCRACAVLAETYAVQAGEQALEHSNSLQARLQSQIKELQTEIRNFNPVFDRLPLSHDINRKYEQGKMLLAESNISFQHANYLVSLEKLTQAKELIDLSISHTKNMLSSYFANYTKWMSWADQTIESSRKNRTTAILVDKFSNKCYVYKNGALKFTFEAELGMNWIGTKRYKGDKATPEGIYKITKKKQNHQTKYYKALLLDYPNGEDKQRFSQDVRDGKLSRSAQIGGLIEIHGGGGKGANWTDGCIALSNGDMDVVFDLVSEGTSVTIVGSLITLDEILNQ